MNESYARIKGLIQDLWLGRGGGNQAGDPAGARALRGSMSNTWPRVWIARGLFETPAFEPFLSGVEMFP